MGFQINQVVVSGNLTRVPEVRQSPNGGTSVTRLGIAHNERRKNQQTGEWEDRAHFFDVTVFGGQGEWLARNAGKGDPVTVAGQLSWRSWDDRETGAKRSAVEIIARDIVIGQRGGGGGGGGQSGGYQQSGGYEQQGAPQQGGGYGSGGQGYQQPPQQAPAAPAGGWGQAPQQGGGYGGGQSGSGLPADTSDFAPTPRGSDPGDDDIPF